MSLQQLREQSVAIGKVQLGQEREIERRLPGGTDPGSDDCSKPLCALQNAFVDSFHELGCKVFQYLENYKHSLLFMRPLSFEQIHSRARAELYCCYHGDDIARGAN